MRICSATFAIAAFCGFSALAWADQIVLNNATFSQLPASGYQVNSIYGPWGLGAIPGWTETDCGFCGQWAPLANTVFNSLPEGVGSNIAFSGNGVVGGTLSQDATTVQAGESYTLSVDIGHRIDMAATGSADLLINGVTYAAAGAPASAGNWSVYTVTYNALQSDIGASIYIQLTGSPGGQGDFQDVELSDSDSGDPVPEPSSATLFAAALAGAVIYRRRAAGR